jgi:hypothetical protein
LFFFAIRQFRSFHAVFLPSMEVEKRRRIRTLNVWRWGRLKTQCEGKGDQVMARERHNRPPHVLEAGEPDSRETLFVELKDSA